MSWRAPWVWRVALRAAPLLVAPFCRLRVVGEVPRGLMRGPLIVAVNHVSPVDPFVVTAACARVGVAPRFMATGGLFSAPVVGAFMRACGHLRVDRHTHRVADALPAAAKALREGSVVLVYPEGRIGLDPWMWPERGKSGVARMALMAEAPVLPVAQWGSHAVLPYSSPRGAAKALLRAVFTRPVVWVRFGAVLPGFADARPVRATDEIMQAIAETLAPLRAGEPELPRYVDPTRPVDVARARR
jgi:1-acyl-sn-glycerol-3-phosphate acyltransferase